MSFVEHNGKIFPAFLFEPMDDRKPDCFVCGDTGLVRETIDEERLDVMFPCWRCRQLGPPSGPLLGKGRASDAGIHFTPNIRSRMENHEIDALVATRIYGEPKPDYFPTQPTRVGIWSFQIVSANGNAGWRCPEFSTDPTASKQLRDKMRADGWAYRIVAHTLLEPRSYSCSFVAPTDSSFGKVAWADTEELAVALAALKAVGVEIPA